MAFTIDNLNKALTIASGTGGTVTVPSGDWTVTSTINVPDGVSLICHGTLVAATSLQTPLLVIGSGTTRNRYTRHVIRVRRQSITQNRLVDIDGDPLSFACGVVFRNSYASNITISECDNFEAGAVFLGVNNMGCVYNKVALNSLLDNQVSVWLTQASTGWCNENLFLGAHVNTTSSSPASRVQTIAAALVSADTSRSISKNIFIKPSFEIASSIAVGEDYNGIVLQTATSNRFIEARLEGAQRLGTADSLSFGNIIEYTDNQNILTFDDDGFNRVYNLTNVLSDRPEANTVYSSGWLAKSAVYDDSGTIRIFEDKTLSFGRNNGVIVDVPQSSRTDVTIDVNERLVLTNNRFVGVFVGTENCKKFVIRRDVGTNGGRIFFTAYDSSGTTLGHSGSGVNAIIRDSPGLNFQYVEENSGATKRYLTTSDSNADQAFAVRSDVSYIFVGIGGGDASADIRSFSIDAFEPGAVPVWGFDRPAPSP